MSEHLDLQDVLHAYTLGLFPMADSARSAEFHWYEAPRRCNLPVLGLHVGRSLRRHLRRAPYDIRVDTAFAQVIDGCAERPSTWINAGIRDLFLSLHEAGFAHSVECWKDGRLMGGVYGLALGGAFCAESMFSREPNASKVALAHLCARLWQGGFRLLDAQFINEHLRQFGAFEIDGEEYRRRLDIALKVKGDFDKAPLPARAAQQFIEKYLAASANFITETPPRS